MSEVRTYADLPSRSPSVPTLYFEDIEVGRGDRSVSYRIGEQEMVEFAARYDPRPMHLDDAAAIEMGFRGITSSAALTMAIRYALYWDLDCRTGALAAIAGLGGEYRVPAPVYVGDILTLTRTVLAKRLSASRPGSGIVMMNYVLVNQDDVVVLDEPTASIMVQTRAGLPDSIIGLEPKSRAVVDFRSTSG